MGIGNPDFRSSTIILRIIIRTIVGALLPTPTIIATTPITYFFYLPTPITNRNTYSTTPITNNSITTPITTNTSTTPITNTIMYYKSTIASTTPITTAITSITNSITSS